MDDAAFQDVEEVVPAAESEQLAPEPVEVPVAEGDETEIAPEADSEGGETIEEAA